MEALILSKTHTRTEACVGGIVIDTLRPIRLMNGPGEYQPGDTPFSVGQIWDIEFKENPDKAPHIEDVIVSSRKYLRNIESIFAFISENCQILKGSPLVLYDELLKWTGSGSGYICERNGVPNTSVGFWISDRDLIYENGYYTYSQLTRFHRTRRFKYVGFDNPIGIIPAGTLIRVSLAKWWSPPDIDIEERCYLQLSGWY